MRLLSNVEKTLCRRILTGNGQNNYLANIIDDALHNLCIAVTKSTKQVELIFTIQGQMPTEDETETMIQRIEEISMLILSTVNLINMLEKEGYIMLLRRANQIDDRSQFGQCIVNLPSVTHQFSDETVSRLLVEYYDKEIISTEEFQRFCNRGFIARDEQRFLRQFRTTFAALFVAIVALAVNICLNLLPKKGETKINQEQVDSIRTDLKAISRGVDSINKATYQQPIKADMPKEKRAKSSKRNNTTKG